MIAKVIILRKLLKEPEKDNIKTKLHRKDYNRLQIMFKVRFLLGKEQTSPPV